MTRHLAGPDEIIHYADVNSGVMGGHAGLNPYKLGLLLWRDLEERWDKGRHGPEWDACDDLRARQAWDTGEAGRGREEMFRVRAHHNDVTFIDSFLTQDFCERHRLFSYELPGEEGQFEVLSREFERVKAQLLAQLTNAGQPIVRVTSANAENRGELALEHAHDGEDLDIAKAKLTLEGLFKLWGRPVRIATRLEDTARVLRYDGELHQLLRGE